MAEDSHHGRAGFCIIEAYFARFAVWSLGSSTFSLRSDEKSCFLIFAFGALEAHDVDACSFDSGNLCFSSRTDEKSRSCNIRPLVIQGILFEEFVV